MKKKKLGKKDVFVAIRKRSTVYTRYKLSNASPFLDIKLFLNLQTGTFYTQDNETKFSDTSKAMKIQQLLSNRNPWI